MTMYHDTHSHDGNCEQPSPSDPSAFSLGGDGQSLDEALDEIQSEYALSLHGVPVRFSLPYKGKADAYRTGLTPTLLGNLRKNGKRSLPCFELCSAVLKLVVADFDCLPKGFGDWDHHRAYLKHKYSGMGLVVESPTGKSKIVFVVKLPDWVRMTREIAIDTLGYLLDEEEMVATVAGGIDRQDGALKQFFVREKTFLDLREHLNDLPVHYAILDSVAEEAERRAERGLGWVLYEGELPDLGLTGMTLFAVRFILGYAKLALGVARYGQEIGLAIPQRFLANQAEVNGHLFLSPTAAQKQASRAIERLIKRGMLEVVNNHYEIGKTSKTYKVAGILKELAKEILSNLPPSMKHIGPSSIDDHDWNATLLSESNYYSTLESFEEWFYSLPGWNFGDRESQMKKIWKWHSIHKSNDGDGEAA